MIEFEGAVLLEAGASAVELSFYPVDRIQGEVLAIGATAADGLSEGAVLQDIAPGAEDKWFLPLLSTVSTDALAAGTVDLFPDPQRTEEDIVITGKRPTTELDYSWDTGGGSSGGTGSTGGGSAPSGGSAVPVAQHTQDCTTDDGAAVQVAKHVMGVLPPDVSGPPNTVTTSSGNDWTKVEFGTVIVRNSDGTFGALNNTIYSSDQISYAALPSSAGLRVQGLWHSHPLRGDSDQAAIDRYPSPRDWQGLGNIAGQIGAVSNPSLWITGPDGITREFKLSERNYFENLDNDPERLKAGEGLEGRERAQACG